MAEELLDPRETPLHPRYAKTVIGHEAAIAQFELAFRSGKLHHAWMITGPEGIGKATLAYAIANFALGGSQNGVAGGLADETQTRRWIHARSHPDLFVLERQLADRKPARLKTEISVEDARGLPEFFARTSGSGTWRVAIVDAVDDLNRESANALLKQVEEPPSNCLLLLISHQPGRVLRTLKSRCLKLPLKQLSKNDTVKVINTLEIDNQADALAIAHGSPGKAIQLSKSAAARAFQRFPVNGRTTPELRFSILSALSTGTPSQEEFETMSSLLLNWTANEAARLAGHPAGSQLAQTYTNSVAKIGETTAYNLDRRRALNAQLLAIEDALKPA